MKQKFHSLLIIGMVMLISFSCKEDEDPSPMEQAMGTYNYTSEIFYFNGSALVSTGDGGTTTGTAIAKATANGFEVTEGGEVQFRAVKVTNADNGFVFDIESQTVNIDGDNYTIEGFQNAQLTSGGSSTKYDGYYKTADKEMLAYFQFQVVDGTETHTFVIEFKGDKQ